MMQVQAQQLDQAIHKWDECWTKRDVNGMKEVFDSNICLHAEGLAMNEDVKGVDGVLGNFSKFMDLFPEHQHTCMVTACNPDNGSAFGFWQDSSKSGEDSVTGMWKVKVNKEGKITDIHFLRQLHNKEKEQRLKDPKKIMTGGAEYSNVPAVDKSGVEKEEFQQTLKDIAKRFSDIWQSGDVSIADEICKPTFKSHDLLKGGEASNLEEFKKMIQEVFGFWHPSSHELDIAPVTNDNKVFVHWSASGKLQDRQEQVSTFGINLLEVDPSDGKIVRSAGFRQLEPNECEEMLRPDAFRKVEA